jgi:hypothetical protein
MKVKLNEDQEWDRFRNSELYDEYAIRREGLEQSADFQRQVFEDVQNRWLTAKANGRWRTARVWRQVMNQLKLDRRTT